MPHLSCNSQIYCNTIDDLGKVCLLAKTNAVYFFVFLCILYWIGDGIEFQKGRGAYPYHKTKIEKESNVNL